MEYSSASLWPGGIRPEETPKQFCGTARALEFQFSLEDGRGRGLELRKEHSFLHEVWEVLIGFSENCSTQVITNSQYFAYDIIYVYTMISYFLVCDRL